MTGDRRSSPEERGELSTEDAQADAWTRELCMGNPLAGLKRPVLLPEQ